MDILFELEGTSSEHVNTFEDLDLLAPVSCFRHVVWRLHPWVLLLHISILLRSLPAMLLTLALIALSLARQLVWCSAFIIAILDLSLTLFLPSHELLISIQVRSAVGLPHARCLHAHVFDLSLISILVVIQFGW